MTDKSQIKLHAEPEIVNYVGSIPLYISKSDKDNLEDIVDWAIQNDPNRQVFFVLAQTEVKPQPKTTKTTSGYQTTTYTGKKTYQPRVYKIVNNTIGRAMFPIESEEKSQPLAVGINQCYFTLPKIPNNVIEKLDHFFREVHNQIGTEAVIMFTYDTQYLKSDEPNKGWGFLVPAQKNTAANCDYDPSTVMDDKPHDDVVLVGTAHSHPLMDAYCSGTDQKDQSKFDGIHITFGWKHGKKSTDYHITLQMQGQVYEYNPEDIFEDPPKVEVSDEVKELAKKVEKKYATAKKTGTTGSSAYGGFYGGTSSYLKTETGVSRSDNDSIRIYRKKLEDFKKNIKRRISENLPEAIPSDAVVVMRPAITKQQAKSSKCLACNAKNAWASNNNYLKTYTKCYNCDTFYMLGETEQFYADKMGTFQGLLNAFRQSDYDLILARSYPIANDKDKPPLWLIDEEVTPENIKMYAQEIKDLNDFPTNEGPSGSKKVTGQTPDIFNEFALSDEYCYSCFNELTVDGDGRCEFCFAFYAKYVGIGYSSGNTKNTPKTNETLEVTEYNRAILEERGHNFHELPIGFHPAPIANDPNHRLQNVLTLCCKQHAEDCKCSTPVLFDDFDDLVRSANFNLSCAECVNEFTQECPLYFKQLCDAYDELKHDSQLEDFITDKFVAGDNEDVSKREEYFRQKLLKFVDSPIGPCQRFEIEEVFFSDGFTKYQEGGTT